MNENKDNFDYLLQGEEAPQAAAPAEKPQRLSKEEYAASSSQASHPSFPPEGENLSRSAASPLPTKTTSLRGPRYSERQAIFDLADETAKEVAASGDAFQKYLGTLARFELYSPMNTLLIFKQNPDATRVKSFDNWKKDDVYVKKHQTGITIVEREDYERDGKKGYNYNLKKLFDISQTNAKQEPTKQPNIKDLIKALVKSTDLQISVVTHLDNEQDGDGAAYLPHSNKIEVMKGLDGESIFRCLSQGIIYANLDRLPEEKVVCQDKAFVACAASYSLCQKYGIDTSGYDFSDAPEYFSSVEDKDLRAEIGAVRDTVADMANSISQTLSQQQAAKNQEAR
jgi:hypothetical protein